MANNRLTDSERQQRRRRRALNKQARRRTKRRGKILGGLGDPFVVALIERAFGDPAADESFVPLTLVPTRRLRRRVAALNEEIEALYGPSQSSEQAGGPAPNSTHLPPGAVLDVRPATRAPGGAAGHPTSLPTPCCP